MKILSMGVCVMLATLTNGLSTESNNLDQWKNLISVQNGTPHGFVFSDLGSWHAYGLSKNKNKFEALSFYGPTFLANGGHFYFSSKASGLVTMTLRANNHPLSFLRKNSDSFPGLLIQNFESERLTVKQELAFIAPFQSLTKTTIINSSKESVAIKPEWKINPYGRGNERVTIEKNRVVMNIGDASTYCLTFCKGVKTENDPTSISINHDTVTLQPNDQVSLYFIETYYPDANVHSDRVKTIAGNPSKEKCETKLTESKQRWRNYLDKITSSPGKRMEKPANRAIAVKSLQTLITNWRDAAGDLKHGGLFPGLGTHFNGFWAWDSWKHSAALANICPQLAMDQIRTMFAFQNEVGMIPDCVRYYKSKNNWRDTKPPLAGWAVWKVYKATGSDAFVREMYPKLVSYHNWWYKERDSNENGLCEYGSTDGSHIAAAWESGMDNAARFIKTEVLTQPYGGTYDQESVDLNAYLCQEKFYLSKMAETLGKTEEAQALLESAEQLKLLIQSHFWDEDTGYFYDWSLRDKSLVKIVGPEGWIPLFTEVATAQQAERIKAMMLDPNRFGECVPLGTLEHGNEHFAPETGYWKGPVWLDQVYFGIKGLKNYGYHKEASALTDRLLASLEGISEPGYPIRENYNPLNGQGLNAVHFSWSAGHLLMLLTEE